MAQKASAKKIDKSVIKKYTAQKMNARKRGVDWGITFWEWWLIWKRSGKWSFRGKSADGYVMARLKDTGPYSPENVEIITLAQNSSDQYIHRREKGETIGVAKKLNSFQVRIIRRLLIFSTMTDPKIAMYFDVSSVTIWNIKHRRTYKLISV